MVVQRTYIDNMVNASCQGRIQSPRQRNILVRSHRRKVLGLCDRSQSLFVVARQGSTLMRNTRVEESWAIRVYGVSFVSGPFVLRDAAVCTENILRILARIEALLGEGCGEGRPGAAHHED